MVLYGQSTTKVTVISGRHPRVRIIIDNTENRNIIPEPVYSVPGNCDVSFIVIIVVVVIIIVIVVY